ncbi:MAG: hypothetical protein HY754_12555 [Nitrospirae bacterium]|nr:hypothetical protein [Nitrospirota bacterium]
MGVITKKIGRKSYAYLVKREGRKVVHKYLGPADAPLVLKIQSDKRETLTVPERFRSLFWDTNLKNIHIRKNARYIIERVLDFGDMDAVQWLQRVYAIQTVMEVLAVSRNISNKSRNFWMIWFGARYA